MSNGEQRVNFEMGELVRVSEQTHQKGMTPSRLGVITSISVDASGFRTGIYDVLFASKQGTVTMSLWHKFLEKVEK